MTDAALPDAGWYPDPAQSGALRWWTGTTWSDATLAIPTEEPAVTSNLVPELESSDPRENLTRGRRWPAVAIVSALILVILGAVFALSAAFNKSNLDTDALAQRIGTELSAKYSTAISVSCPGHVPLAQGATFECVASDTKGTQRTVLVTQTSDNGNVTYVLGN